MEIWVRSQNKEFLKLCNEFRICERVKDKKIVGYSVDCFDVELGVYSTKERALKAMDLLQSCICGFKASELLAHYCVRSNAISINCDKYVIQMPANEEVEE